MPTSSGTNPSYYDPRKGEKPDYIKAVQKDLDRQAKARGGVEQANKSKGGAKPYVPTKPSGIRGK